MLTRDQYLALLKRMRDGENLSRSELDQLSAYQRDEAAKLATRLGSSDATADDATRVDELATEIGDTQRRAADLPAERTPAQVAETMRAARDRITALVGAAGSSSSVDERARQGGSEQGRTFEQPEQRRERLHISRRFSEAPELQAYRDRGFIGQVAVDFPDVDSRTLLDSTGVGFNGSRDPYVGTIDPNPDRALRLADLVDRQTTDLNAVPYLIESANTGAAAEVAEGAPKPEAAFTFTEDSAPVRTVAHWVPITRQAAEDNSTLVGYINGRLSYGLGLRLDAQILNGNGTAPNIRGILNTSGLGSYTPGAAEARIITIRKAITLAQISEYQPDTVVLHPTDWQNIELDTDTTNNFRVTQNVQNSLTPRLWGLNVVVTTAITVATYLVGAFKMGATLWERHGVRLLMSDSHGTNFTANILVLLAELRAALTVWRPAAFVKGAFV